MGKNIQIFTPSFHHLAVNFFCNFTDQCVRLAHIFFPFQMWQAVVTCLTHGDSMRTALEGEGSRRGIGGRRGEGLKVVSYSLVGLNLELPVMVTAVASQNSWLMTTNDTPVYPTPRFSLFVPWQVFPAVHVVIWFKTFFMVRQCGRLQGFTAPFWACCSRLWHLWAWSKRTSCCCINLRFSGSAVGGWANPVPCWRKDEDRKQWLTWYENRSKLNFP